MYIIRKESSKDEVTKAINGLNWIASFWLESMEQIAQEGRIDIKKFNDLKASGLTFLETFVVPVLEDCEVKLAGFPEVASESTPETTPETSSVASVEEFKEEGPLGAETVTEAVEEPAKGDQGGSGVQGVQVVQSPQTPSLPQPVSQPVQDPVPFDTAPKNPGDTGLVTIIPESSVPDGSRPLKTGKKGYRRKFKSGLSTDQRNLITRTWIYMDGSLDGHQINGISVNLNVSGTMVQGWVSYLDKIYQNNHTFESRKKGWDYIVTQGLISGIDIPDFFHNVTLTPAFSSRKPAAITI